MKFSDFVSGFKAPQSVKLNLGPGASDEERLAHYAALARINPNGFRASPSSRKNPKFHSRKPSTLLEKLAARVEGGAA